MNLPATLNFIRQTLDTNWTEIAEYCGVDRVSVHKWLNGSEPRMSAMEKIMELKTKADEAQAEALGKYMQATPLQWKDELTVLDQCALAVLTGVWAKEGVSSNYKLRAEYAYEQAKAFMEIREKYR